MVSRRLSGTEGYADEASALVEQYESISFEDVHRHFLHLIPSVPSLALDIGAGTGRDAAALAAMGHRVIAVEPTAELRAEAARLHLSPNIEWMDDGLPELGVISARPERFDLIMLTAVWMHLDEEQRRTAMPVVARLLRSGGILMLSLRHGPVPEGRRMFDVSSDETIELAEREGLRVELCLDNQPGLFGRTNVSWTRLAFAKSV
jgi:SAM-dependent methyltransferase